VPAVNASVRLGQLQTTDDAAVAGELSEGVAAKKRPEARVVAKGEAPQFLPGGAWADGKPGVAVRIDLYAHERWFSRRKPDGAAFCRTADHGLLADHRPEACLPP
jgi:hypothetical protein